MLLGSIRATRIYLGRLVKPFGIKGELKFVASDDFWREALDSKHLELSRIVDGTVRSRAVVIERMRPHGNNFVVKLEGVADRNSAEEEVGGELFVELDNLDVELPERELPFQVVGLTVRTEKGRVVGQIRSVIISAAHPVYVVEAEDGEVMIPAVPAFVIDRDDEAGTMTIREIPGLLDG
jgi:16S rRNA processing protein RimM